MPYGRLARTRSPRRTAGAAAARRRGVSAGRAAADHQPSGLDRRRQPRADGGRPHGLPDVAVDQGGRPAAAGPARHRHGGRDPADGAHGRWPPGGHRGRAARPKRRGHPHRHHDDRLDHRAARDHRPDARSGRVRAPHPGAGGQGALAHQRPLAGPARRRRQPRRPAAPGVPARQPPRHAGRRQAGAARGRSADREAREGVGRARRARSRCSK